VNTFTMVRTEHLNHHEYLFGGQMLKWVDEFAYLAAARDYPGVMLVTRAMDSIEFRTHVLNGSILRFRVLPLRVGTTSVTYEVKVYADAPGSTEEALVFSNHITFVALDGEGRKAVLPFKETLLSQVDPCGGEE
jgi:acyl-CoA hydrolase